MFEAFAFRRAMRLAAEVQEKVRRDEEQHRADGTKHDDAHVRQAIVYSREDVSALVVLAGLILGELKMLRWIALAVTLLVLIK